MKDIILAGSGGCMREIAWQLQEQRKNRNQEENTWNILGYVDCKKPEQGSAVSVGGEEIAYLGDDDFLLAQKKAVNVAICTGSPALRKKIAEKLRKNPQICFPNILLGDTRICSDVQMGEGCVVSMDTRISTNVEIGDFVFLNMGSRICHDGKIGDFVTLSPEVKLAGNVRIGCGSEIGMGAKVIQGICIGRNVVAGAGSVIIRDVEDNCTVVGVPAEKIKDRGENV